MQEESGEKVSSNSNGTAKWLCPLCQKGQADRASLSQHLTDQHSVLATCLDKLLDISVLKQEARQEERKGGLISSAAAWAQERPSEDIASEPCQPSSDATHRDKEMEEDRMLGQEGGEIELQPKDETNEIPEAKQQNADKNEENGSPKSPGKNGMPGDNNTLSFKCSACLETFPSRTSLSVHYYSASHVQKMTTIQSGEADSQSPSAAILSRPYISKKPYQCAVCRVSYNHSITLESHLKSVLHQTRSRSAANSTGTFGSTSTSSSPNTAVNTAASGSSQLAATTTTNNNSTPGTMMVTTAGDAERIQTSQAAPSLITPPVASAQAVSAFLTLLTSSPSALSHPLIPSLYAPGAGTDAAQIVPQPHMVMPLILNGLHAQQAQQCPENQQGQLLAPCVPFVGLNAAQQALLTQRLSMLQHQWPPVAVPANTPAAPEQQKQSVKAESSGAGEEKMLDGFSIKTEEPEEESCPITQSKEKVEWNEDVWKAPTDSKAFTDHVDMKVDKSASPVPSPVAMAKSVHNNNLSPSPSMPSNSCYSPVHLNLMLSPDSTPQKSQATASPGGSVGTPKSSPVALSNQSRLRCSNMGAVYPELPVLSEFQSEVLWAFFESRSEADAASPPREDCEALAREVGLSEEEVRKWLCQARYAKQRQRQELAHQQGLLESARATQGSDNDYDDEENSLIIAEEELEEEDAGDESGSQAMDLSSTSRRRAQKRSGRDGQGDSCLTSDSENEVYTSVIVTDEESQNEGLREAPESPLKEDVQCEVQCDKGAIGGKVLRSTTVFLSDAEDDDDDEDGGGSHRSRKKKRKGEFEHEVEVKRERLDPDVDLELEAQADPPSSQSFSIEQIPSAALHTLPLSLTPFSTPFLSPYVLSLAPSLIGVGNKVPVFTSPPNVTSFSSSLLSQSLSSINQTSQYLSNGGDCETALDLSMGKNYSSSCQADKTSVQKGQLLDGLGLRPTSQGLVVVQVKPESLTTMTSSNTLVNSHNLTKSNHYSRPAEKLNSALLDKEKNNERDKERGQQQQRRAKGKRYHDMRRSRTIIQAEQLDILYGCYFKDPNPGKNEFEQIAEWVHLPKKVVQIWFQNMRARERKGEVRFISDGTLAAVGKPLIKFTWPLSKPIFSNKPVPNNTGSIPAPSIVRTIIRTEGKPPGGLKKSMPVPIKPKEVVSSPAVSVAGSGASSMPKTKLETTSNVTMVKVASSVNTPILLAPPKDPVPIAPRPDQQKRLEESEEEKTDEEEEDENEKGPLVTNRMVPKMTMTAVNRPVLPQKQNGLNYWTAKVPIKINTLSREQLGLPAHTRTIPPPPTPSIAPVSPNIPNTTKVAKSSAPVLSKSSPTENSFLSHSSSRRPRTHLSCLQLYILQSCYETCAHPNAIECESLGTALNLPLKVVQIWFQNTRAKEKRWRLQQEKLSLSSGGKVDVSSGSYLHYNALKANRPILPKPVQLTFTEYQTSPATGQSASIETVTGCCNACKVSFKSGAAARAHVFAPHHLAVLRTTDFGQPTTLVNKNGTGSALASSGASSGIEVVIELPQSAATSNS